MSELPRITPAPSTPPIRPIRPTRKTGREPKRERRPAKREEEDDGEADDVLGPEDDERPNRVNLRV